MPALELPGGDYVPPRNKPAVGFAGGPLRPPMAAGPPATSQAEEQTDWTVEAEAFMVTLADVLARAKRVKRGTREHIELPVEVLEHIAQVLVRLGAAAPE